MLSNKKFKVKGGNGNRTIKKIPETNNGVVRFPVVQGKEGDDERPTKTCVEGKDFCEKPETQES